MIKLKNPYAEYPGYNCFGCSPSNHHGLRMEFFEDGEGNKCSEGKVEYFVLSREKAETEFHFPGKEAFCKG
jgi:hypothetical protein